MYTVVKDNKDILRYRGLLTPGETVLALQDRTAALALLQLSALDANSLGRFSQTENENVNASTPFMRLLPSPGGQSGNTVYDFYFPYTPQGIDYSDLSDEIAEIQRAGTTPIVTFRGHRLMKVSMEFLVAVPQDGLILDVEDSLEILRFFSINSQRSVIFYHMDRMLVFGDTYRKGPSGRPLSFNITEMSINARQRNASGKITQATVRMSLVENRNPQIVVTRVPPFKKRKPPRNPTPRPDPTPRRDRVPSYTGGAKATPVEGVRGR